MPRKKSLTGQLLKAYQDAKKAKAAELKRQEQEQARRARAAEQSRAREERERAKQEREQAQAWERGRKEKERQDTERARKAAQIERDLEKRQAAKKQADERQKRDAARAKAATERQVKQARGEQLRAEATERSGQVLERIAALDAVLLDRQRGLYENRPAVEDAFNRDGADSMTAAIEAVVGQLPDDDGLRGDWRAVFAPETRELVVEVDFPGQEVVPAVAQFRYKASSPPEVVPQPRKEIEVKQQYARLVACLALRAIDEVLAISPPSLVNTIAFNGHVRSKDRATGKAIRPCLVSVRSTRADFEELVLDEPALDPVLCLRHLNAIVSQHPYDLEAVRPVVTFDLGKYKFAPEVDVVAGLDSRPDLMALDPIEFEHLIRRLFEAYGMKAWVTQASRDDGVDAVATNEDPMTGGLCIIQAKRTKNTVPAEAVRALAGVMHDKAAAKGILITTAWFGKTSLDFAYRTGRMQLIDGRGLKALLQEHLGIDALIGLPKVPPGWVPEDLR